MGVVNQGLNYVLGHIFPTGPNTWYLGLINNSPTPVLAATDVLASHPGWVEVLGGGTSYTGNRPLWTNGAPNNQQVTNATYVAFAITATVTIFGLFVCDVATGTAGNLFGTAAFVGGSQTVVNSDTLQITLSVSAASS